MSRTYGGTALYSAAYSNEISNGSFDVALDRKLAGLRAGVAATSKQQVVSAKSTKALESQLLAGGRSHAQSRTEYDAVAYFRPSMTSPTPGVGGITSIYTGSSAYTPSYGLQYDAPSGTLPVQYNSGVTTRASSVPRVPSSSARPSASSTSGGIAASMRIPISAAPSAAAKASKPASISSILSSLRQNSFSGRAGTAPATASSNATAGGSSNGGAARGASSLLHAQRSGSSSPHDYSQYSYGLAGTGPADAPSRSKRSSVMSEVPARASSFTGGYSRISSTHGSSSSSSNSKTSYSMLAPQAPTPPPPSCLTPRSIVDQLNTQLNLPGGESFRLPVGQTAGQPGSGGSRRPSPARAPLSTAAGAASTYDGSNGASTFTHLGGTSGASSSTYSGLYGASNEGGRRAAVSALLSTWTADSGAGGGVAGTPPPLMSLSSPDVHSAVSRDDAAQHRKGASSQIHERQVLQQHAHSSDGHGLPQQHQHQQQQHQQQTQHSGTNLIAEYQGVHAAQQLRREGRRSAVAATASQAASNAQLPLHQGAHVAQAYQMSTAPVQTFLHPTASAAQQSHAHSSYPQSPPGHQQQPRTVSGNAEGQYKMDSSNTGTYAPVAAYMQAYSSADGVSTSSTATQWTPPSTTVPGYARQILYDRNAALAALARQSTAERRAAAAVQAGAPAIDASRAYSGAALQSGNGSGPGEPADGVYCHGWLTAPEHLLQQQQIGPHGCGRDTSNSGVSLQAQQSASSALQLRRSSSAGQTHSTTAHASMPAAAGHKLQGEASVSTPGAIAASPRVLAAAAAAAAAEQRISTNGGARAAHAAFGTSGHEQGQYSTTGTSSLLTVGGGQWTAIAGHQQAAAASGTATYSTLPHADNLQQAQQLQQLQSLLEASPERNNPALPGGSLLQAASVRHSHHPAQQPVHRQAPSLTSPTKSNSNMHPATAQALHQLHSAVGTSSSSISNSSTGDSSIYVPSRSQLQDPVPPTSHPQSRPAPYSPTTQRVMATGSSPPRSHSADAVTGGAGSNRASITSAVTNGADGSASRRPPPTSASAATAGSGSSCAQSYGTSSNNSSCISNDSSGCGNGGREQGGSSRRLPSGRGCVGLHNLGNTCFLNSILQSMNAVPELVEYFCEQRTWRPKALVAPAYAELVSSMWSASYGSAVSPSNFVRRLSRHEGRWGEGGQQDSQEFLHALLEVLQTETNRVKAKPAYRELEGKGSEEAQALDAMAYARSWHDSIVDDVFGGTLQSTIQCQVCKRQSHCFETTLDLALPIPTTRSGSVSVQDCLQSFVELEKLEGEESYKCEVCKRSTPHSKRLQIYRPPKVLVLTLKRFSSRAQSGLFSRFRSASKNNTSVCLEPDCLDLTPYCNPLGLSRGAGGSYVSPMYQLIAISHHSGSLEGGHYTATARSCGDGGWYNFNDSCVRKDAQPSGPSSSAYVLFYRQLQPLSL